MFNLFKIVNVGNHKIIKILFFKMKFKSNIENYKSVKILVAYHKKAPLIKNDFIEPIHAGRSVALENSKDGTISTDEYQWMYDNMIGDDTGDNISHLNRYFNEMTAIYWAWKNYDKIGNPDYFGFMHYRSIFLCTNYPVYSADSFLDRYGYHLLYKMIFKDENVCITGYYVSLKEKNILFFNKLLEIINKKHHKIYAKFKNWAKFNCAKGGGGGKVPPKICLLCPRKNFSNIVNLFFQYCLIYRRNLAIININQL